jgi:hypothetical protein
MDTGPLRRFAAFAVLLPALASQTACGRDAAPAAALRLLPASFEYVASPPPLPPGAVGYGGLLYQPCVRPPDCAPHLVFADGRQYRLDTPPDFHVRNGPPVASLSPNGRWLAQHRPNEWLVRDLTGTTSRRLPAVDYTSMGWSADGNLAVSITPAGCTVTDLRTGATRPIMVGCRDIGPAALLSTGELLRVESTTDRPGRIVPTGTPMTEADVALSTYVLQVLDPSTGQERRHVGTLRMAGIRDWRPYGRPLVSVLGDRVAVPVIAADRVTDSGLPPDRRGLAVFDLTAGRLLAVHDVTAATEADPFAFESAVAAYLAEGVPLVHGAAVMLVDPATGGLRTALTIPPHEGQPLLFALPGGLLGSLVTSDG